MSSGQITLSEKLSSEARRLQERKRALQKLIAELKTKKLLPAVSVEARKRLALAKDYLKDVDSTKDLFAEVLRQIQFTEMGDVVLRPTEPKKRISTVDDILRAVPLEPTLLPAVKKEVPSKPKCPVVTRPRRPRKPLTQPALNNGTLARFIAEAFAHMETVLDEIQYMEDEGIFRKVDEIPSDQLQTETDMKQQVKNLIVQVMQNVTENDIRSIVEEFVVDSNINKSKAINQAVWIIQNANTIASAMLGSGDLPDAVTMRLDNSRVLDDMYTEFRQIAQQLAGYYMLVLAPQLLKNVCYGTIALFAMAFTFDNELEDDKFLNDLVGRLLLQSRLMDDSRTRIDVKGFVTVSLTTLLGMLKLFIEKPPEKPSARLTNADGTNLTKALGSIGGFLAKGGWKLAKTVADGTFRVLTKFGKSIAEKEGTAITFKEGELQLEEEEMGETAPQPTAGDYADGANYNPTLGTLTIGNTVYSVGKPADGDPDVIKDMYSKYSLADAFRGTSPDSHYVCEHLAITYAVNILPTVMTQTAEFNNYTLDQLFELLEKLSFGYYWEQAGPVSTTSGRVYSINIKRNNEESDREAIRDLVITYVVAVTRLLEYITTKRDAAERGRERDTLNDIYRRYWVKLAALPNRGNPEPNVPYAFHSGIRENESIVALRSVAEALQMVTRSIPREKTPAFYNPVSELMEDTAFNSRWTALNAEMPQISFDVRGATTKKMYHPIWFSRTMLNAARAVLDVQSFSDDTNIDISNADEVNYPYLSAAARPNTTTGVGRAVWKVGNEEGLTGDGHLLNVTSPPPLPTRADYLSSDCGSCGGGKKKSSQAGSDVAMETVAAGGMENLSASAAHTHRADDDYWYVYMPNLQRLANSGTSAEIKAALGDIMEADGTHELRFKNRCDAEEQAATLQAIKEKLERRGLLQCPTMKCKLANVVSAFERRKAAMFPTSSSSYKLSGRNWGPNLITLKAAAESASQCEFESLLQQFADMSSDLSFGSATPCELKPELNAIENFARSRGFWDESVQSQMLIIRTNFEEDAIEQSSFATSAANADETYYDPSDLQQDYGSWSDYRKLLSEAVFGITEKDLGTLLEETASSAKAKGCAFYEGQSEHDVRRFMQDEVIKFAMEFASWKPESMQPHVDVILLHAS